MTAFLRAIDNKTWKAIIKGWSPPVKTATEESSSTAKPTLKKEADWTPEEDAEALANSKALNAIFNGVDKNMFRLINNCTVAKKAWEILRTAHEGTSRVRMSRLQILTTQFETLRMFEEQNYCGFSHADQRHRKHVICSWGTDIRGEISKENSEIPT